MTTFIYEFRAYPINKASRKILYGIWDKPIDELIEILTSSIELLSLPDNNFTWSSWEDQESAVNEIVGIITDLRSEKITDKLEVAVLFAPTGPLQEVSLSSGWADVFIKLAEKYDEIYCNLVRI